MTKDIIPPDTKKLIDEWKLRSNRLKENQEEVDKLMDQALAPIAEMGRTKNPLRKLLLTIKKYLAYKRLIEKIENSEFNSDELFR